MLNAENLVAFGFVFWLLLDLIQGAYDLSDAADWAIRDAFIAIGVSAAMMWVGVAGRPWPLPNWIKEIAQRPMDTKTVGRLVPVCFLLGMFNFAYATGFDLSVMFSYLGEQRWAAPWGRAQLGGWDAFLDQMQYFGYVLPSLTALLIVAPGIQAAGLGFDRVVRRDAGVSGTGRRPAHHRRDRRRRDHRLDPGAANHQHPSDCFGGRRGHRAARGHAVHAEHPHHRL